MKCIGKFLCAKCVTFHNAFFKTKYGSVRPYVSIIVTKKSMRPFKLVDFCHFYIHFLHEIVAFSPWILEDYFVIFAATLYCQHSSDHLICWTSFLWMLSFLFNFHLSLFFVSFYLNLSFTFFLCLFISLSFSPSHSLSFFSLIIHLYFFHSLSLSLSVSLSLSLSLFLKIYHYISFFISLSFSHFWLKCR